ncbi:hypothetical protein [Bradyrhizobium sp.]|uniref:hypothetical protein n=1 Tax=Bradyrhizobium sp. TaxID=376 RepID=UPI0025BB07D7|nr:hypothetical protein [Bradyrhizobium sp.]
MRKLAIVLAVGGAALIGGSAANAGDGAVKARVTSANVAESSTDISAGRRHGHWHGHRHWGHRHHGHRHHWGHRHHRPYYSSYGYAPRHHGYYGHPGYYGGGPGITFSFGGHRGW